MLRVSLQDFVVFLQSLKMGHDLQVGTTRIADETILPILRVLTPNDVGILHLRLPGTLRSELLTSACLQVVA